MNSRSGCLSRIPLFWRIWILFALIAFMIRSNPIPYLVALILFLVYFWSLQLPIENSACRFFVKENIIDTEEHLNQQKLEIYNYAGLLRNYLKLALPPRSDLRSLINLKRHDDAVTTLTVTSDTSDGKWLISGSKDKTLRIWDLEKRRARFILTGHQDPINSVVSTPDSRHLVSILADRTIKVWDIGSWIRKFQLKSESRIAYDKTHLFLALVTLFLEILVFIIIFKYRKHIQVPSIVSGYFGEYRKTPPAITGESYIVFAGLLMSSGLITRFLYDGAAFSVNRWLGNRYNSDDVGQIVVTPDNETVIFGASNKTLKVRGLTNQTQPLTLGEHGDRITSVAVIDNNRVISGSYDKSLKGWKLDERREIFTLDHSFPVTAVAVIPNCDRAINRDRAISGSSNGELKVWNLVTCQTEWTFKGHGNAVRAIAVTPDGQRFVSASSDRSVKFWHVSTDEEVTSKPITSFTADYPLTCCTVASTVTSNGSKKLIVIVGDESGQIHFLRVEGSEFLP